MAVRIKFVTICTKFVKDPVRGRRCLGHKVKAVAYDTKTKKILAIKKLTKAIANKVADFT